MTWLGGCCARRDSHLAVTTARHGDLLCSQGQSKSVESCSGTYVCESGLQRRLDQATREVERLRAENERLRMLLGHPQGESVARTAVAVHGRGDADEGKPTVRVYDYTDTRVPVLRAMHARRLTTDETLGGQPATE